MLDISNNDNNDKPPFVCSAGVQKLSPGTRQSLYKRVSVPFVFLNLKLQMAYLKAKHDTDSIFTNVTVNRGKSAASVSSKVVDDLRPCSFTADWVDFLDKLLPVKEEDIKKILNILIDNKTYDTNASKWTPLLEPQDTEEAMYGPTITIANAIQDALMKVEPKSTPIVWYDKNHKAPISIGEEESPQEKKRRREEKQGAKEKTVVRPDLIAVFERVCLWSCLSRVPRC